MHGKSPKVDGYLRKHARWQAELNALRSIILDCQLTEEIKWRVPCYTFSGRNIVLLGAFKEYCALSFVKGALLKDSSGLLQLPGADTQSSRVVRIAHLHEIAPIRSTLAAYILEAIQVEKDGLTVPLKKISDRPVPVELQSRFDEMPLLQAAFQSLTPGRQRAYYLHISSAKLPQTRVARVEKCIARILAGKSLDDD